MHKTAVFYLPVMALHHNVVVLMSYVGRFVDYNRGFNPAWGIQEIRSAISSTSQGEFECVYVTKILFVPKQKQV